MRWGRMGGGMGLGGCLLALFGYTAPPTTPAVWISGAQSQVEGNSGARSWTYTINRSPAAGAVTVNLNFSAGGTDAADWQGGILPAGLSVSMADGVSSAAITIFSAGDSAMEADETFTLSLVAPAGYVLGSPGSATGTILNDDIPPVATIYNTNSDSALPGSEVEGFMEWAQDLDDRLTLLEAA